MTALHALEGRVPEGVGVLLAAAGAHIREVRTSFFCFVFFFLLFTFGSFLALKAVENTR